MKYWPNAIWGRKEFIWLIGDSSSSREAMAGNQSQSVTQKTWRNTVYYRVLLLILSRADSLHSPSSLDQWQYHLLGNPTSIINQDNVSKDMPEGQFDGISSTVESLSSLICLGLCRMDKNGARHQHAATMLSIFRVWKKNKFTNTAGLWEIHGVLNDLEEDLSVWLQNGVQLSSGNKSSVHLQRYGLNSYRFLV